MGLTRAMSSGLLCFCGVYFFPFFLLSIIAIPWDQGRIGRPLPVYLKATEDKTYMHRVYIWAGV